MDRARDLLADLPHPLHLFVAVTGTAHYHFGTFRALADTLPSALRHTSRCCHQALGAARRVLDVGCGLGGTAGLLGAAGRNVTGIDPCPHAIRFACQRHARCRGAEFRVSTLEQLEPGSRGERYDGVLMLEALQHMADLPSMLGHLDRLLEPGGVAVISDVFKTVNLPWERVTFHDAQDLVQAAAEAGFEPGEFQDSTAAVAPTLDRLSEALEAGTEPLVRRFAGRSGDIAAEIREVLGHIAALREALLLGDLVYGRCVLRRARP